MKPPIMCERGVSVCSVFCSVCTGPVVLAPELLLLLLLLFVQLSVLFRVVVVTSWSPIQRIVDKGYERHGVLIDAKQQKQLELGHSGSE